MNKKTSGKIADPGKPEFADSKGAAPMELYVGR